MPPPSRPTGSRSVHIGGDATGNVIQTGDHNTAELRFTPPPLPAPADVDMRAELERLRELLAGLASDHRKKIDNALEEARDELGKPAPDRDEVGQALDRALGYARKASGFVKIAQAVAPPLAAAAAWLGERWHGLAAAD